MMPALGSIKFRADISSTAWSESAQEFVRDCIRRCSQNHDRCKLGQTLLPTRVLEVGKVGDERLRLFETQSSTFGQYIALSYCWGSDQPLKTTSTNIKDMTTTGLQLSGLPPTLVDAVHVTRSLGFKYLWIDSLCIIQDSVEDWERQSQQMSTIYEKAWLVIAASSSSSATQGFLNHQRKQHPCYLRTPDRYGAQVTVAAHRIPESGVHSHNERSADPLDQRAWAFQEKQMATRCLIFSVDELQWVCKTSKACECALPAAANSCHSELQAYCDGTLHDKLASTELALQAGYEWCSAVGDYSRRRLTRADDKLPAISGIASRFGANMGFQYVAGLWAEDMIQGLAWSVAIPLKQPPAPLPTDYRAPSFSWASINDGVSYATGPPDREGHWIPYCSLADAGAKVPGRNPFGKVSDAWVTIRGPVARGFIDLWSNTFRSDDGQIDLRPFLDSAVAEFRYTSEDNKDGRSVCRCTFPQPTRVSKEQHKGGTTLIMQPSLRQASVWLLHLGRSTRPPHPVIDRISDFYLLLGKSPRDPQKYERIGSCQDSYKQPIPEHRSSFTTQTITIL